VSLQGTSALDTIFDARGKVTGILNVSDDWGSSPLSHEETFIDSLSLRGARAPAVKPTGPVPDGAGAAIHIWSDNSVPGTILKVSRVTVSNCFIYDNVVGIAVNAFDFYLATSMVHSPRVVNNTIAWNACGVWCGQFPFLGTVTSNSGAVFINNILDSGSPSGFITGLSGFEGITQRELEVTSTGPHNLAFQDFNAWEWPVGTYVNRGIAIAPNWPAVSFPPFVTAPPRVQIQGYTQPNRPGALYVNDILRRAPPQAIPVGYDYSRHDFRLAPCVTTNASPPLATQGNRLVNQGLDISATGYFNIVTPTGTIASPPGLPASAESCPVHAGDWDAEGFGNPRVQARAGFPPGIIDVPNSSSITTLNDIGADEMGDLIMAGFVPNTRMYYYHQVPGGAFVDQTMVLYFDIVGAVGPRPWSTLLWGGRHEFPTIPLNAYAWFNHTLNGPDADQGNFTTIPFPFFHNLPPIPLWDPPRHEYMDAAWLLPSPPNPLPLESIMRSLECDFGGSLLPDLHPRWNIVVNDFGLGSATSLRDEYGSNPWWGHPQPPKLVSPHPSPPCRDNPTLYHNIGGDLHDVNIYGLTSTSVVDATMCPPGAGLFGPIYLDLTFTNILFGPWGPCTGGTSYLTGPWGYGDVALSCPERIPYFAPVDSLGVRWNCQTLNLSNLQTFLTIVAGANPALTSAPLLRKAVTMPAERLPTPEECQSFPSRMWRVEGKR